MRKLSREKSRMRCNQCGSSILLGDEYVRRNGAAVCMDCLPDFAELLGLEVCVCENSKEETQLPGQLDMFGGVEDA